MINSYAEGVGQVVEVTDEIMKVRLGTEIRQVRKSDKSLKVGDTVLVVGNVVLGRIGGKSLRKTVRL